MMSGGAAGFPRSRQRTYPKRALTQYGKKVRDVEAAIAHQQNLRLVPDSSAGADSAPHSRRSSAYTSRGYLLSGLGARGREPSRSIRAVAVLSVRIRAAPQLDQNIPIIYKAPACLSQTVSRDSTCCTRETQGYIFVFLNVHRSSCRRGSYRSVFDDIPGLRCSEIYCNRTAFQRRPGVLGQLHYRHGARFRALFDAHRLRLTRSSQIILTRAGAD